MIFQGPASAAVATQGVHTPQGTLQQPPDGGHSGLAGPQVYHYPTHHNNNNMMLTDSYASAVSAASAISASAAQHNSEATVNGSQPDLLQKVVSLFHF